MDLHTASQSAGSQGCTEYGVRCNVSVPQAAPTPARPEWVRLTIIVDFSGIVDFLSKS